MHVAGHELGEAVGDGDDRLAEVVVGHPGGAPQGAGAGHVPAVRGGPRTQLRHAYQSDTDRRGRPSSGAPCPQRDGDTRLPPRTCAHPAQSECRALPPGHGRCRGAERARRPRSPPCCWPLVGAGAASAPRRPAHAAARGGAGCAPGSACCVGGGRRARSATPPLGARAGAAIGCGRRRGRSAPALIAAGRSRRRCSGCPGSRPAPARGRGSLLDGLIIGGGALVRRLGARSPSRPGMLGAATPDGLPCRSCWPR